MKARQVMVVIAASIAGAAAPHAIGAAMAETPTGWSCYIADRFPDVAAAREWRGAKETEQGLNAVAAHVPSGTVITVDYPIKAGVGTQVAAPLICVR